jgi:hypothetical protein
MKDDWKTGFGGSDPGLVEEESRFFFLEGLTKPRKQVTILGCKF